MKPLSNTGWNDLKEEMRAKNDGESEPPATTSDSDSMCDVTQGAKEQGVVLEAAREVRLKIYMGQVSF